MLRPEDTKELGNDGKTLGLLLLLIALGFNAVLLAPELRIGRAALNDSVFHLAAAERLQQSLARAEPFLDPWVAEWSLGYPVWRSYQPLPHLVAAGVLWLTQPFADHAAAFAALQYLTLVLFPLSTYVGARLLGLRATAAGIASLLVAAPAGTGDLGRYGLGYGAAVWRGSGLYTQLVALHFLVLSLGVVARAVDSGRRHALAALLVAATVLSHLVFGYVAVVSAAVCAVVGSSAKRAQRGVHLIAIVVPALLLLAWFVVPLMLAAGEVNHSRWEPAYKWDSFGATYLLQALGSGVLLDGQRAPLLSALVAVGTLAAIAGRQAVAARRLLALALVWLVLFFGRATWGHLLLLAAVPGDLHLHRLQAAFELAAVLLAAWGIDALGHALRRHRGLKLGMLTCVGGVLLSLGIERAGYLREDARWGEENLARHQAEQSDLDRAFATVRAILAERPGRVSAGKAGTWGGDFKVGATPVYALLSRAHLDQVSFLYHAMSLTSDVMVLRDEADAAHDAVFGVRAVVAPAGQPMPAHLRLRARDGRFAVYESPGEGYFGLVDIGARYTGPKATFYEPSAAWLGSAWLRAGVVMELGGADGGRPLEVPQVGRWEPLPAISETMWSWRGEIIEETKDGETYAARVRLQRPCYALVKITWFPDLVATIDGRPAPVLRVTPGFAAVPVGGGEHTVTVRYAPGTLKPVLLFVGVVSFAICAWGLRTPALLGRLGVAAAWLNGWGSRLATPRLAAAAALMALMVAALHPLFRGQLIDGHDALEYPPRLVEFSRALQDGQFPPLWAPDLGSGHGQPLFEFAPPLVYLVAYPFYAAGCRLTDALQLGLALLYAAGAVAIYRWGRHRAVSRSAAVAGVATWLFAPYLALDLYVRAAFAEAAALAVAPLALLGLVAALDRPSAARIALGSAAVALVALAHNAAALLLFPAFALVVLARWSRRAWAAGGFVLLGGLGLSAFFWLPALTEKGLVKTELLRQGLLQWNVHIISPGQLLWSPWRYGFSLPGPDDGMSFALGPVHLALGALGLMLAVRPGQGARGREAVAWALITLAGAWLATTWSAPLWARIETLQYLAYPWRALLLPPTFLPLLAVPAFEWLRPRARLCALALLIGVNLTHVAAKGFLVFDDEYYAPDSIAQKGINTTSCEEYEPIWVQARPPYTSQHLSSTDGRLDVHEVFARSGQQQFVVRAEQATPVEASTFYYPGWRVAVDGSEVPVEPSFRTGTMRFSLTGGTHHVRLRLGPTPVRRVAALLTLATAAALAGAIALGALGRAPAGPGRQGSAPEKATGKAGRPAS